MEDELEQQIIYEQDEYECINEEEDWGSYIKWFDKYDKRRIIISGDLRKEILNDSDDEGTILSSSSSVSNIDESVKSETEESLTHPCLKVISVSDSEFKFLNLFNVYPIPKDPGLNQAFWILYPNPPIYKSDGVDKFFDLVKLLKLAPVTSLRQQLKTKKVNLKYYRLDPEVIQALTEALTYNFYVKSLDLQENWLTANACYHLNRLLLKNIILSSLNLSDCKIGPEGAAMLEDGISNSIGLRELNLSRCDLGNEGLIYIGRAVAANTLLQSLNIANNKFDDGAAMTLQKMLILSVSLEKLNLSWNDLYSKETSEKLFNGLLQNFTLTDIDLSWNSMGKESLYYLCNFIRLSKYIKRLDFSANRFTDSDILQMGHAILSSRSLQELELNKNPLGSKGITGLIKILSSDESAEYPLKLLDLEYFWATKDALPLLDQLKEIKPNLIIKLGGILGNYKIVGPDLKELYFLTANYEAMNTKKKKERKNFGHFILSLDDRKIRKDKFIEKIENSKIKISENLAREIANQFLVTKKVFDQAALKESYMYYFPDTKLPPPPPPPKTEIVKDEKMNKGKKNKKGQRAKKGKTPGKKKNKGKKKKT